jgi:ABC-2 type transport system ATP-binding protein
VTAAPPALRVEGLVVRYGSKTAVDGLDLTADAGQVVAVLGRNGAGKTTTVETAEGYRRPDSGRVRVLGLDPHDRTDRRRLHPRLGVMLQSGGVYPSMGPAEAVRLFASYYDHPVDPDELLARMGLEGVDKTPWRRLSGGEQQRLSMALALVGRPEIVFLDEPTAGVDPAGRTAIREQVAALKREGACVVLTTHELEEAERMADRIVIIDHGRVAAEGTLAELTAAGADDLRFTAPAGIDCAELSSVVGSAVTEEHPGEYRAAGRTEPATVARLTAWLAEHDLALIGLRTTSRLEEIFLALTAETDQ